jgi:hypothetical protein
MGYPVKFHGSNMVLKAPEGAENVSDMHTFTNGLCSVSCWELTAEELAEIQRTGRIFLSVFSGRTQPPVFVGDEETMRCLLADYGVWRKQ